MVDARIFDVSEGWVVRDIQKIAVQKVKYMASNHYPHAVLNGKELQELAETQCDKWWRTCYRYDQHMDLLPGVKRIFVAAFVAQYQEDIEAIRRAEAEKKAAALRQAEKEKGASVEIRSHRQQQDGVRYLIDFFDPDRMTQAISFLLSVKDDGVVELEEI